MNIRLRVYCHSTWVYRVS